MNRRDFRASEKYMKSLRTPIQFVVAVLCAACVTSLQAQSGLRIEASYASIEHSMDSNSTHETFTLAGSKLTYNYEYGGYHPGPNFERKRTDSKKVNPEDLHKFVMEKKLNRSLNRKVVSSSPHAREVHLHLDIRMGAETFVLNFDGTRPDAGADKDFDNALAFCDLMRSIVSNP